MPLSLVGPPGQFSHMNRSPLALIENLAPYARSAVVHARPISLPLLSFVAVTVVSTRNAGSALGTGMGTISSCPSWSNVSSTPPLLGTTRTTPSFTGVHATFATADPAGSADGSGWTSVTGGGVGIGGSDKSGAMSGGTAGCTWLEAAMNPAASTATIATDATTETRMTSRCRGAGLSIGGGIGVAGHAHWDPSSGGVHHPESGGGGGGGSSGGGGGLNCIPS